MSARNGRLEQAVDTIALHLNIHPRPAPHGDGPHMFHLPTNDDIDRVADHFGTGSLEFAGRASTRVTLAGVEVLFLADQP